MLILFYYACASLILVGSGSVFEDTDVEATFIDAESPITDPEIDEGGFFNTGVDFGRFFSLLLLGIGLPTDTPVFFAIIFAVWQSIFSVFAIGFVISSIWNG